MINNIIEDNIQNNNYNNLQINDFTLLQDLSTNETETIINSNFSQIENSSNSYSNVPMKFSSNDKREEKNINLNKSSLGDMFSNFRTSSNLSNDLLKFYCKLDINNEILKSFFEEYFQFFDLEEFSEKMIYKEVQIIEKNEKIKSKVNNTKKIEIKHKFDKIINSNVYYCKLISKELITENLKTCNKEEINKFLNYKDNKICQINIKKDKIKINITLEDDKNNHCVFPIGLYENYTKKLIYRNIFIFSIIITD